MTKIEGQEVVYSRTVILKDDVDCEMIFSADSWTVKLFLRFCIADDMGSGMSWGPLPDGFRVTCHNWNNALGTATPQPIQMGITPAKRKLFLSVFQERIEKINRATVQVTVEATGAS